MVRAANKLKKYSQMGISTIHAFYPNVHQMLPRVLPSILILLTNLATQTRKEKHTPKNTISKCENIIELENINSHTMMLYRGIRKPMLSTSPYEGPCKGQALGQITLQMAQWPFPRQVGLRVTCSGLISMSLNLTIASSISKSLRMVKYMGIYSPNTLNQSLQAWTALVVSTGILRCHNGEIQCHAMSVSRQPTVESFNLFVVSLVHRRTISAC